MIIAPHNQRGGVGKTTTSVHIAHAAALYGKRVLLVDSDPQGSLRNILKIQHDSTLHDLLDNGFKLEEVIVKGVRTGPEKGTLDVIISDKALTETETKLIQSGNRAETVGKLREALAPVKDMHYDLILIDSPPGLSPILQSVYHTVDSLLVPIAMDYMSVVGSHQVIESLSLLKQDYDIRATIAGILPVAVDHRLAVTDSTLTSIKNKYEKYYPIFPPIRIDATIAKSGMRGQTLYDRLALPVERLTPDHRAAWDYYQVMKLLIEGQHSPGILKQPDA